MARLWKLRRAVEMNTQASIPSSVPFQTLRERRSPARSSQCVPSTNCNRKKRAPLTIAFQRRPNLMQSPHIALSVHRNRRPMQEAAQTPQQDRRPRVGLWELTCMIHSQATDSPTMRNRRGSKERMPSLPSLMATALFWG